MQGSDAIQLTPVELGLSGCGAHQFGIPELQWPGSLGYEHHTPQRVTKDGTSKLACLGCVQDGPAESLTARVQRGFSETTRCASTGDSPGHPPLLADFFSILL